MGLVAFFLKNPIGQKIGIVLLCAIASFIALNWYGNSQFEKGKQVEKDAITESVRKELEAKLKSQTDAIAAERKTLDADRASLIKEKAQLVPLRAELTQAVATLRATSATQLENIHAIVNATPLERLADDIKRKSADLGYPADQAGPGNP